MRIEHLKKRCEEIAADVNTQFDQLSGRLLNYKGDPNWLIECFAVVFNDSATTVLEYEKEVKQLYKDTGTYRTYIIKVAGITTFSRNIFLRTFPLSPSS